GMGYALLSLDGDPPHLVSCGLVPTPREGTAAERLLGIADALDALIAEHAPTALALERLYFNKNVRTAMSVSEARGVALVRVSHSRDDHARARLLLPRSAQRPHPRREASRIGRRARVPAHEAEVADPHRRRAQTTRDVARRRDVHGRAVIDAHARRAPDRGRGARGDRGMPRGDESRSLPGLDAPALACHGRGEADVIALVRGEVIARGSDHVVV